MEFNPLEVNLDELKEDLKKKKKATLNKYTIQKLASIIEANGLSKKAIGTLKSMGKDDLSKIILEGDSEPARGKKEAKEQQDTATEIVKVANELKQTIHQKPLNPFVQKQGTKAVATVIAKLDEQDESVVDKMGIAGTILGLTALAIDTLFSTEKLADKGQEKLKKATQKTQEPKEDDKNKQ